MGKRPLSGTSASVYLSIHVFPYRRPKYFGLPGSEAMSEKF